MRLQLCFDRHAVADLFGQVIVKHPLGPDRVVSLMHSVLLSFCLPVTGYLTAVSTVE